LDFGYRGTGSLGNEVWLDVDGGGTRNGGEPGIGGRIITLTGTDTQGQPVSFTTTTDTTGNYNFPNLPPSAGAGYTVTVTNPVAGTLQTYDLDFPLTPNVAVAPLTAGQNRVDVDFGYRGNASLGDRVWIDFTNDGVQDGFEPGVNGVTVTLTGRDINGNPVNISTVTANVAGIDGVYNFPNLIPSNATGYTVTLTAGVPTGLVVGTELDNGAVNRANPNGTSTNNKLVSNQNRIDVDFGLVGNASIAGKVWRDDDASGTDNTEPNFRGVVVSLVWNGNVIATRTTNAAGEYLFDNLPPDNYTVVIDRTDPANERLDGFTQTFDADGTGTPDVIAVTLPANTDVVNRDFGYRGTGSIGDLVWQDVSNNRVFNTGVDVVLANVTLRLTGTDEYGNPISVTDITDANGNYLFGNLPRGTYTVSVIGVVRDPNNNQVLANTADPDGGARGVGRVVLDLDALLGRVEDVLTMDFGYRFVPPVPPLPTPPPPGGGGEGEGADDSEPEDPPTRVDSEVLELPTEEVPVIAADVSAFGGFPFINTANGEPLPARLLGLAPNGDDVPASNGVIINACSTECVDFEFYHTNRTGNWEIYRLGDYRDQTDANPNISQGEGEGIQDVAPSRSPNAEWVAFASNRDGNWEIYVAPTNGLTSEIRRVTTNSIAIDTNPVWGPNNQVIYETTRNGNWDLYMVDMVTGDSVPLITSQGNDLNADWSPDGTKILFQSDRYGTWQLYELDLQTRTIRLISDDKGNDVDGQYDNSGGRILFRSDRDGKNAIYIVNRSRTGLKRISDVRGNAVNATWSPNDGLIAYQSDLDGDLDIYVYGVANEQTRKLTDNDVADFAPSWKCGTDELFFTSDVDESPDIYQVNALPLTDPAIDVLEDAERLTDDAADDVYPMGAPSNEVASREGILAGVDMLMGAQTDFLAPETNVTPRDTNVVENVDWEAIVGCVSKVCQPWNVYLSNPDDVWNIFRLDGADSAVNLSNGERNDYSPSLSPDKRFIAFTSVRDGDAELFVVTTDGSGELKQLTSNLFVDDNPVWALDGQYLVYESAPFGNFDLYRRDLTTGITQRITSNVGNDRNPFMSFGNGAVIFNSDRTGQQQLFELTFATGIETRLSDGTANDMLPIYSYDGGKILFTSDRDSDNALFIMERDGSNVTRISPEDGDARNGAWSLDSQYIAFQSAVDGDSEIFVYEVATGETRQLTTNDAEDTTPAWRCDTGDLLITSDIMGNPDIFEIVPLPIDALGIDLMTDAEQLTSSEDDDTFPLGATDEVGSREEVSQ
jgi:Tol biopolymer transport system component